ncbi:MAG: hypothetical protein JWO44_1590 [Bacteroidetes bacterium]|nr:hypothetical protein [Bacteroidota bacterium]
MIIHTCIKKAVVYALLCIYGFALLKPVMPLANDIIAHTFYKMEHLATVHFENGKYHVHQELAAAEQQQHSKGDVPSGIYETLASHIAAETVSVSPDRAPVYSMIIFPSSGHPLDAFLKNATPPPEA